MLGRVRGPRVHRDPTVELLTQAPRRFFGASTAATFLLVSPVKWGGFLRSHSNERRWVAARGHSSMSISTASAGSLPPPSTARNCRVYATLGLIVVLSTRFFPRTIPTTSEASYGATRLRNHSGSQAFICGTQKKFETAMLSLVVTLLIIALIAGILGFGGIAGAAVGIAKIVFFRRPRAVPHFPSGRRPSRPFPPRPIIHTASGFAYERAAGAFRRRSFSHKRARSSAVDHACSTPAPAEAAVDFAPSRSTGWR